MTRIQTRDKIRVEADVKGDNAVDYLINQYLNEELRMFMQLRRYPEAFLTGVQLLWEQNLALTLSYNFAILPSDLQHLDVDNIFFDTQGTKINLARWIRIYINTTNGDPIQFRRQTYLNATTAKYDQVLEITPNGNISYPTDSIYINYWRKLSWDDETSDFPISELETVVAMKVTERLANLQNSGLAAKYANLAKEQYIASRGVNTGDKT